MENNVKKPGFWAKNKKFFALLFVYFTFFMVVSTFVLVKLTKPAGKVSIPDVTGKKFDYVYNGLVKSQLKPVVSFYDAADIDPGIVLKQHPAAGTVISRDSRIKLLVSRNNLKVEVPELSGNQMVIAKNKLATLNIGARKVSLGVGMVTYVPSPEHAEGVVVGQSPKAGEKVAPDTKVHLLVSMGALTADPLMPEVSGQYIDLAQDLLLSLGLQVDQTIVTVDSIEDSGKILGQSIKAGESIAEGAVVELKVGYFERENRYYEMYQKVSYIVAKKEAGGLFEAWAEDDLAKRVVFSKKCVPGEKFEFVYYRKGNSKIEILRDKVKQKVLRVETGRL